MKNKFKIGDWVRITEYQWKWVGKVVDTSNLMVDIYYPKIRGNGWYNFDDLTKVSDEEAMLYILEI